MFVRIPQWIQLGLEIVFWEILNYKFNFLSSYVTIQITLFTLVEFWLFVFLEELFYFFWLSRL